MFDAERVLRAAEFRASATVAPASGLPSGATTIPETLIAGSGGAGSSVRWTSAAYAVAYQTTQSQKPPTNIETRWIMCHFLMSGMRKSSNDSVRWMPNELGPSDW